MDIRIKSTLERFVNGLINRKRFIAVGTVIDIIKYKKTPEGVVDSNSPEYAALVSVKGQRQVIARIASTNAGQVLRGSDSLVESNRHSYGKLRLPEIGERVILAFPLGHQNMPLIIGMYYGDRTTSDKIPSIERHEDKDIHVSGVNKHIDAQGNIIFDLDGHTLSTSNNTWSVGTQDKRFTIQNKSGSKIILHEYDRILLEHSSGAGIEIDETGTMYIRAKLLKFEKVD